MKVTVLAFGIAKEIINGTSVEVELSSSSNAGDLKKFLEDKYPRLKELRSFLVAINDEYAHDGQIISPGDEIALIPPVSGG